ncbi:hypothetical protein A6A04_12175 [Paramagnetospirillum marisnigri]|uniref:protein O-GlcNAc transferase n=2 Tax=Paramagnetospirillum marisnigri TaxID=1285242 RepID=A0A178MWE0_9PROT|nr:hypothetical protein A6A04_12175 [Paramagnetospirillum marisnigri]
MSQAEALLAMGAVEEAAGLINHPLLVGRLDEATHDLRHRVGTAVRQQGDEEFFEGFGHHREGRITEAVTHYQRALSLNPGLASAACNLGAAFEALGRPDEAEYFYRQALAIRPDHTDALFNLAAYLARDARSEEALDLYEQVCALSPDFAEGHNNRGATLNELGRFVEAAEAHQSAVAIRPDFAEAWYNLGNDWRDIGDISQSVHCYQRSIELKPDLGEAHNALGNVIKTLGRIDDALDHYRRALDLDPLSVQAHTNLLVATLYHPNMSDAERFAMHRDFEARHAAIIQPTEPEFTNFPDPDRRLRIGYVSANLYNHPSARNLLPLIEAHDRDRFDLYFYADLRTPDAMTRRFQDQATGWRLTQGKSDAAVARMIRDDDIDVLVSLAGHFDENRPLVAAYKPAPIRVSFHDPVTSGLGANQYLITDPVLTPRGISERFTERPLRLPAYYIHVPVDVSPEVTPPPMLERGYPTFGSFNNPAKLSDPTLRLWARLMAAVPEARLRLKYRDWFSADSLATRVLGFMAEQGVGAERVELRSSADSRADHMAQYADIDVALDPFPFTGSTTTFEALWMGVPVVTLPGPTMVSRWSASMLRVLRLPQLIAASADNYVDICRRLANSPEELSELRFGLRVRSEAAFIANPRRRARQLERLYRAVWRRWAAQARGTGLGG